MAVTNEELASVAAAGDWKSRGISAELVHSD